jgi:hypothetical protein
VNECEIYGNDDDETGGSDVDEESSPKASFCSHSCTNLIGKVERQYSI